MDKFRFRVVDGGDGITAEATIVVGPADSLSDEEMAGALEILGQQQMSLEDQLAYVKRELKAAFQGPTTPIAGQSFQEIAAADLAIIQSASVVNLSGLAAINRQPFVENFFAACRGALLDMNMRATQVMGWTLVAGSLIDRIASQRWEMARNNQARTAVTAWRTSELQQLGRTFERRRDGSGRARVGMANDYLNLLAIANSFARKVNVYNAGNPNRLVLTNYAAFLDETAFALADCDSFRQLFFNWAANW